MQIEVFLTGTTVKEEDVRGRTVVVIDVLRACSTIVTALHNGARAVIPVADMAQAGKIASNLDPASYLLGGERDNKRIQGYHLGNSPLEYTPETVANRSVILNTTNGTAPIANARSAEHLVAASLLNAGAIVAFVREMGLDVTIICGGTRNRVALEDTLCAGLLIHRLWGDTEPEEVSDAAHIAYTQYLHDRDRLEEAVRLSNHAQRLVKQGYGDDVDYCVQLDSFPVVPYFVDNRLVLRASERSEAA